MLLWHCSAVYPILARAFALTVHISYCTIVLRSVIEMASVNVSIRMDSKLNAQTEQSLYADLLRARTERAQGLQGRSAKDMLSEIDQIIAGAEQSEEV